MSHENPYALGTQVLGELGYNVGSHGDLSAHFDSLVNADLPSYAGKFYSPSEHEQIADVKYKKVAIDYDEGLREISEAMAGAPLEAYIPVAMGSSDTGSSSPTIKPTDIVIKNPKKEILDEIVKAQGDVVGKQIVFTEVDEIIIRRRVRQISITQTEKDINQE